MCVAAAPAAVSGLSSIAGFVGQSQQANAQADFQNSRYAATIEAAGDAYEFDITQINKRAAQEDAAFSQSALDNARAADGAVGASQAAAAGANVGGAVVADVAQQFRQIESENEFSVKQNRLAALDQLNANLRGSRATATNRINAATPQPIQGPSILSLGFDLLGAGLNGYMAHQNAKPPRRER